MAAKEEKSAGPKFSPNIEDVVESLASYFDPQPVIMFPEISLFPSHITEAYRKAHSQDERNVIKAQYTSWVRKEMPNLLVDPNAAPFLRFAHANAVAEAALSAAPRNIPFGSDELVKFFSAHPHVFGKHRFEFEHRKVIYSAVYEWSAPSIHRFREHVGGVEMVLRLPNDGFLYTDPQSELGSVFPLDLWHRSRNFVSPANDQFEVLERTLPALAASAKRFFCNHESFSTVFAYSAQDQRCEAEFEYRPRSKKEHCCLLKIHFEVGLPAFQEPKRSKLRQF